MTGQEQIRSVASIVGRTTRKVLCTMVALHWFAVSVHAQDGEWSQPPAVGSDLRFRPMKVRAATTQGIAVASYINPLQSPLMWQQLIESDAGQMPFVVANVLNGPGSKADANWTNVIRGARAAGIKVIGYVDSGYMGLPGQLTRLGTNAVADWIVQAEQDVDAWYALYPGELDGIFFDDGYNRCTDSQGREVDPWYTELNQYVKRHHPGALTVLNPGTVVPDCYEDTADILLTFEGSYLSYFGRNTENPDLNYKPLAWGNAANPDRIWHIIYDVPAGSVAEVADQSRAYGAGYIEITNDVPPNPYDDLPDNDYWRSELEAVTGTTPLPAGAAEGDNSGPKPNTPRYLGLNRRGVDYTSVGVQWQGVPDAARYHFYLNDNLIATLPAGLNNAAVIGSLKPGRQDYKLSMSAESQSGQLSGRTTPLPISTPPAPAKAIDQTQLTHADPNVVYKARFLTPYAFHRVFIQASDPAAKCWIVSEDLCAHWVIENNNLLSFASDDGNVWKWELVRTLNPLVQGYVWTWTVSAADVAGSLDRVVFQGEGYSDLVNVPFSR
jgi:hypothetical protein